MKHIKLILSLPLICGLALVTTPLYAQGQGKGRDKQEERAKEAGEGAARGQGKPAQAGHGKDQAEGRGRSNEMSGKHADELEDEREARGRSEQGVKHEKGPRRKRVGAQDDAKQGNAYGGSKGEVNGREFGQARAEDARVRNAERRAVAAEVLAEKEALRAAAKTRIGRARTALEAAKASGSMSPEEVEQREQAIQKAEARLEELDASLEKAKATIGG
jgi:colicin import membrane protein